MLQIRKKDQINIETKNKTVRFIGELAKFKMFSKTDTLHCLKVTDVSVDRISGRWIYIYAREEKAAQHSNKIFSRCCLSGDGLMG